jgi:hypothetical protein
MKIFNIKSTILLFAVASLAVGCYKLQKDYDYVKYELDPHINMTAKDFLLSRGTAGAGSDTVFKWMQLGIEYAGIDLSEYEKPGRTYIFLHNSAIRTISSGKVNGGFFFDHPIVVKDANNTPIKSKLTPAIDSTRPAVSWKEYSQQTVKNYFLYLIVQGEYGFTNLGVENKSVQTLLPAGTTVPYSDSRLGWVVTKTTPNPDATAPASIVTAYPTGGSGFDPEGKMNLKLGNNDQSPIVVNDKTNDRTAGYYATNGQVHVYDKTVHPFRYSYQ